MHPLLAALVPPERSARVDALVEAFMRTHHVAGMSVAVARRGAPLYVNGFGLRSLAPRATADAYTVYPIGSLTKQFTAAIVMQEVARGAIALQAPLRRYLPDAGAHAGDVTIAQLLGQTSGIASYTDRASAAMERLAAEDPAPATLWQLVANEPLAFAPGTQWQYSNSNYLLLGMVLQHVSGDAYPTLLEQRILRPLQLLSTAYGLPPYATNVATGYAWHGQFAPIATTRGIVDTAFSAGGMASNAPDVVRWLEDLRSGRVVSEAAFRQMTASVRVDGGVPAQYGFGFFVGDWYGYRIAEHDGYLDGFSSEDALVLDDGLELALLSNADRVDLQPLAKSLVAIFDAPRDANLYATASQPAENENPRITAAVRAIAATPGFAALGTVISVEFVERTEKENVTYDRYRVTFSTGPWWVTIGYLADGTIRSLSFAPDAE